jgi:acyl-CoA thioesterase I
MPRIARSPSGQVRDFGFVAIFVTATWRHVSETSSLFRRSALAIAFILSATVSVTAHAETIKIVAFGDSGVFGSGRGRTSGGVAVAEAYPAKLERALRAAGWDVSVSNLGVPGATAHDATYWIGWIPAGTRLTIVQFGGNDRNLRHASEADIAHSLGEIIRRVHAMGSLAMLVRTWRPSDAAAYAEVQQAADSFVTWYSDVHYQNGPLRPDYDSGDGSHLNAAGTDVIVAHAVPDVERLLLKNGLRPGQ